MSYKKTITPWLLALWLVLSLAGCASESGDDAPTPNQGKVYLAVAIHVNDEGESATRASDDKYYFEPHPWGGEHGNGDHSGETYEQTVSNMSLLFYTSTTADLTDGDSKIEKVIYFPSVETYKYINSKGDEKTSRRTIAVQVDPKILSNKDLKLLVIANAGDLSHYQGRKLSDVRDQLITDVFNRSADASFKKSGDLTGFSSFIMSSHDKKYIKGMTFESGSGTEEDPFVIDHEIERLAARIDILPHVQRYKLDKNNLYCNYCYDVTDASNNVIGGFVLEYVRPYNVLTSKEYVFKRTASDASLKDLEYLGLEKDVNNKSTNYVVSLASTDRSSLTFAYPAKTAEEWAKDNTFEDFYKTHNAGKTHTSSKGTKASEDKPYDPETAYYILDYVKENTSFDNDERYATGLVFKGTYYDKADWVVATDEEKKAGGSSQPKTGAIGTPKAYTYVIRHSDPDGNGTTSDPMHYGIVRNNIYRVRIDGVTGKGPDGMKLTINVVPWTRYEHEEVIY